MYVSMCTYLHVDMWTCRHKFTCGRVQMCKSVHVCTCTGLYMCTGVFKCVRAYGTCVHADMCNYVRTRVHVFTSTSVQVCMRVTCVQACMPVRGRVYIFVHAHTEMWTKYTCACLQVDMRCLSVSLCLSLVFHCGTAVRG